MKKRILASILAVLMVVLLVPAVLISSISAATTWVVQNETFETGTFDATHAKFGNFFDNTLTSGNPPVLRTDIWSIGETGGNKFLLSPEPGVGAINNFKPRSIKAQNPTSVTQAEPLTVKFDIKFSSITPGTLAAGGGYAIVGFGSAENNLYGWGSYNLKVGATEVAITGKKNVSPGDDITPLANTATGKTLAINITHTIKVVYSVIDASNVQFKIFIDDMTTPVVTAPFALSGYFGGYVSFGICNAKYSVDNLSIYKGDD